MNCDECGRRPATIRYTEIVDGQLRAWSLCEPCSRERGVGAGLASISGPLVNILMGLLEDSGVTETSLQEQESCPQCGLTYGEFRRTGRLGCAECYEAFKDELLPLLRRIHGCTEHVGRFPSGHSEHAESLRELRALRSELDGAVRREDYERAAELRDEMRAVAARQPRKSDVDS